MKDFVWNHLLSDDTRTIIGLIGVAAFSLVMTVLFGSLLFFVFAQTHLNSLGYSSRQTKEEQNAILNTPLRRTMNRVNTAILVFWIVLILGLIPYILVKGSLQLVDFLSWASSKPWFIPVSLVLAYVLYVLRTKVRYAYAVVEIIVGIAAICTSVTVSASSDIGHLVAVLGGIYIVVRGLDNLDTGLATLHNKFPKTWRVWNYYFKWNVMPA